MPEPQLSPIVRFATIERPACPSCRAQMMLARIVPAFVGTYLHRFGAPRAITSLRRSRAHNNRHGAKFA